MTSASRTTIYMFTDWYAPGFKAGGPIQSVLNLAELLKTEADIKIITRNTDYGSNEPYQNIKANEWVSIDGGHDVLYLSKDQVSYKQIKKLCKVSPEDVVIINGLFSFYFSILPLFFAFLYNHSKTFVAVRGMLHRSALAVKPFKKQLFIAFSRGFGLFKKVTLLASSDFEKIEIEKSLGKMTIAVVPNIPVSPVSWQSLESKTFKKNNILTVLFLGRISPEKNPMALVKALQTIKDNISVKFIGSGITIEYTNSFQEAIEKLPANVKIQWIKEMPHRDILRNMSETDVMVLPSHGENFGHAIFESFANGVPVIIGNNTPWKDIDSQMAGIEIVPDDSAAIAAAIKQFMDMDNETYKLWQKGALQVADHYFATNNFKQIYLDVLIK
ncbi:MAG: glycosyltransferase [Bacteroidota bacterium]